MLQSFVKSKMFNGMRAAQLALLVASTVAQTQYGENHVSECIFADPYESSTDSSIRRGELRLTAGGANGVSSAECNFAQSSFLEEWERIL